MIGSVYHHLDYQESPMAESKNDCDETCPKSCPDCGGTGDPAKFKKMQTEAKDTHCSDKCCGSDVKAEDCTCPPTCKHCNCNAVTEGRMSDQIIGDSETMSKEEFAKKYGKEMADEYYESVSEGKSPHKKGTKKYKKHMAAMHAESLQDRLTAKLESKKKK